MFGTSWKPCSDNGSSACVLQQRHAMGSWVWYGMTLADLFTASIPCRNVRIIQQTLLLLTEEKKLVEINPTFVAICDLAIDVTWLVVNLRLYRLTGCTGHQGIPRLFSSNQGDINISQKADPATPIDHVDVRNCFFLALQVQCKLLGEKFSTYPSTPCRKSTHVIVSFSRV